MSLTIPKFAINGWYKPSKIGWFMIILPTLLLLKHWWFWHVPPVSCRCAWSPVGGSSFRLLAAWKCDKLVAENTPFCFERNSGWVDLMNDHCCCSDDIWWSYNDYWLSYEVSLIHHDKLTRSYIYIYIWLVLSTPLKNMSSSVGMMTFPTEWKVIN